MSFQLNVLYYAKKRKEDYQFDQRQGKKYIRLMEIIGDKQSDTLRRARSISHIAQLLEVYNPRFEIPSVADAIYLFAQMIDGSPQDTKDIAEKLLAISKNTSKTPYERVGECMHIVLNKLKEKSPSLRYQEHRILRLCMTRLLESISFNELDKEKEQTISVSDKLLELENRWKQYTDLPFVFCNQFSEYAFYPGGNKALSSFGPGEPLAVTDEMVSELFEARRKFWSSLSPKETLLLSPNYSVFAHHQGCDSIHHNRKRLLFAHALYEPFDQHNATNWVMMIGHNLQNIDINAQQKAWIEALNQRVGKTFETVLSINPKAWKPFLMYSQYTYVKAFETTDLPQAYSNLAARYCIVGGNESVLNWLRTNNHKDPQIDNVPNCVYQLTSSFDPMVGECGYTTFHYSNVIKNVMLSQKIEPIELTMEPF